MEWGVLKMTFAELKEHIGECREDYRVYVSCYSIDILNKIIEKHEDVTRYANGVEVDKDKYAVLFMPYFDGSGNTISVREVMSTEEYGETPDTADVEVYDFDDSTCVKLNNIYINDKEKYIILC